MARTARGELPAPDHPRYRLDARAPSLVLNAVRGETIAFQLLLRRTRIATPRTVTLPPLATVRDAQGQPSPIVLERFIAHYHPVDGGDYTWGPRTRTLPSAGHRPDALLPERSTCPAAGIGERKTGSDTDRATAAAAAGRGSLRLPETVGEVQAVWFDAWVPPGTAVGRHQVPLELDSDGRRVSIRLSIDVLAPTLPDTPGVSAVAELYRSYRLEGVGEDWRTPDWQRMSHCYQQLAHAHRAVFIERIDAEPPPAERGRWLDHIAPMLDGSLFTAEYGYRGPGRGVPVDTWRLPWPQTHDIAVDTPLADATIAAVQRSAADWSVRIAARDWPATRWFAYLFDEVDGPNDESPGFARRNDYVRSVHADMARLQRAIDRGTRGVAGAPPIDLLWTSHTNPATWRGQPGLDLVGTIRLWAPNAHAADPALLAERVAAGERAWVYHSGHPAIGGHAINLPGTDLRSWGVIAARYGLDGVFMWAANLGQDARPFAIPTYRVDDDRIGNGTLVYPGNALARIGHAASPGPLPSMRLKAWRRGLQDAQIHRLASAVDATAADAVLQRLVPVALADAVAAGRATPSWPDEAAAWIQARQAWLDLLAAASR